MQTPLNVNTEANRPSRATPTSTPDLDRSVARSSGLPGGSYRVLVGVSFLVRVSDQGRRQPVITTNDHGQPIVLVPLANHPKPVYGNRC